jgi:DNA-binding transcriptional MerR regulator
MIGYSISDLENLTGIKAHTIRIWEKRYQVVTPKRTPTNIRFYNDQDLLRLLNISTLSKHGFKISKMVSMTADEIAEKISDLSRNPSDFDSQINNLVLSMLNIDQHLFEKVLSNSILKLGFEKTVVLVLFPMLERVGLYWQLETINPAQEHFVSNLIRQKLIVAIDGLHAPLLPDYKTFLLYLPESEYHELGLLFLNFLIRKQGHKAINLGQNVPFGAMIDVVRKCDVDFVVTYFVSAPPRNELPGYIQSLAEELPGKQIMITGNQLRELRPQMPSGVTFFENSEIFKNFLKSL